MLKNLKRTAIIIAVVLITTITSVFAVGDVLITGTPLRVQKGKHNLSVYLENTTDGGKNLTVISVIYGTDGICRSVKIADVLPVAAGRKESFGIPVELNNNAEVVKLIAVEEYEGMLFPVNSQMLEWSARNNMKLVNQ